jgi:hypothetical protein
MPSVSEISLGQVADDLEVDLVLAERLNVLREPQILQPPGNVQRRRLFALSSGEHSIASSRGCHTIDKEQAGA